MEIVPYTPALLPGLTVLVNTHIAQIPPGWTVTEEQVAATLASALLPWSIHYPEDAWNDELETLCALECGQIIAAFQWMRPAKSGEYLPADKPLNGQLTWAFAQPERGEALQSLLFRLLDHARHAGYRELRIGRFAFGVGWLGIPVVWQHIIQGFEAAGFTTRERWVIYAGYLNPLPILTPADIPSMRLDWREKPEALEWELALRDGEALVGECQAWGIPPHFAGCPGYTGWMTIEWLGVEEPYQRKGFGRRLLLEQMRRQAQRGIRHFICWTGVDNLAARSPTESLGFRAGPECWELGKKIDP